MTCRVIACEQRSAGWYQARLGVLTASNAAAMLSKPKKGTDETVGRRELKLRLAIERTEGAPVEEDRFESDYMRRGLELEADAIGAYEAATGELVQSVGFLRHETLPIGCSPDGIIGDFEGGLEVKCPKFTTHYDYLQRRQVPNEYLPQITHSLFVTGFPWWDFCSYCPTFVRDKRLFVVRVWRDEAVIDAYALAFSLFWSEVERLIEELRVPSGAPELTHA